MKIITLLTLVSISLNVLAKNITDMAGRSIEIPDNIERILPYDLKLSLLLFPVASHKLSARAMIPGKDTYEFISDEYAQIPEIDVKNIEAILENNPQIIIAGSYTSFQNLERYEKLQKRTHIPVVVIDLSINKLDETYRFLGEVIGNKEKCMQCAAYLKSIYAQTEELMAQNPLTNSGIYYTIGGSGLMTDPSGSKHTEVFDYLKLNNVAKVPVPTGGHANVNMEQVLIWNPRTIFVAAFKANKDAYKTITSSLQWSSISAVKNNKVYKVPALPFGWFDHPPSINRIPGVIWLSELFYMLPKASAEKQIKDFYQLFYKYDLSETEYQSIFN